jgi:hypothetical protein
LEALAAPTAIPLSLCTPTTVAVQRGCFFAVLCFSALRLLRKLQCIDHSPAVVLALCPVFLLSLFFFSTMKFANAIKLFSDGHAGQQLITNSSLPVESFPDGTTWNQLPKLDATKVDRLHGYSFLTPAAGTSGPLKILSLNNDTKAEFVEFNVGAIRFLPNHRIWQSDDIVYALQQRAPSGASLLLVARRILREDASYSEPLIIVAGPTATPL